MIDLKKKEICGPWADVMRYYSPQTLEPVFTPTAFLMRHESYLHRQLDRP